jgi:microcin C transport system substrate-binding protein
MRAQQLLAEAGWQIRNGKLTDRSGKVFTFEILLNQPELERVINPFRQNLARLGIQSRIRVVDPAQYVERMRKFDYDMTTIRVGQSLSPGNEQRNYWGSQYADQPGSQNLMGIKNPVVDALIEQIIAAPSREQLIFRTRALDRVLLAGHYVIPQYYIAKDRIAAWNFFERPKVTPKYSPGTDTWWVNPQKLQQIRAIQNKGQR